MKEERDGPIKGDSRPADRAPILAVLAILFVAVAIVIVVSVVRG